MTFKPGPRQRLFILLVSWMSFVADADNMQLDGNLLLTGMDAGSSDNFKSGRAITLHYNYYFNNWLAADAGLLLIRQNAGGKQRGYRWGLSHQYTDAGIAAGYQAPLQA